MLLFDLGGRTPAGVLNAKVFAQARVCAKKDNLLDAGIRFTRRKGTTVSGIEKVLGMAGIIPDGLEPC